MRRTVWAVRPPGPCRYPSRPAYARAQMSGRRGPPKTHRSLPARGPGLNIPVGTAESPPGPRTDKGRFCRRWRERDRPGGRPCPLRRPSGRRALRHTAIVAHGRRRRIVVRRRGPEFQTRKHVRDRVRGAPWPASGKRGRHGPDFARWVCRGRRPRACRRFIFSCKFYGGLCRAPAARRAPIILGRSTCRRTFRYL